MLAALERLGGGQDRHLIGSQDPSFDEGSLRLREYLGLLRARKWTILSITVLMLAGTIGFSLLQTPIYESEAEVLVKTVDTSPAEQVPLPPNLETERRLVTSDAVANIAARRLGVNPARAEELVDALSVSVVTNTEILEISFADADPEEARLGAEAFAEGYLDYRRRQVIDDIVAASEAVQARINARG